MPPVTPRGSIVGVGFTALFAFELLEMDTLGAELVGLPVIDLFCRRLEPVPKVFP